VSARFEAFTRDELSAIHHALRLLAKYPDEREVAEPLADEAWATVVAHADVTEAPA
jgi:hypothetical protein